PAPASRHASAPAPHLDPRPHREAAVPGAAVPPPAHATGHDPVGPVPLAPRWPSLAPTAHHVPVATRCLPVLSELRPLRRPPDRADTATGAGPRPQPIAASVHRR